MMKKAVFMLCAVLATFSVYGQAPDTTSTVVGKKLNFEVPIFGITSKDTMPILSLLTFDEFSAGYNHLEGVPSEMKPSGWYVDLSLITLRYRPWRDGNEFSIALTGETDVNLLRKGHSFADDGSIMPTPSSRKKVTARYYDNILGLKIGYVREFADWKAGAFVVPGLGNTWLRNNYSVQGISGVTREDNMISRYNFRLGFKAGIWYQEIGIYVGYRFAIGNKTDLVPTYDSLQLGVSIRY